MGRGRGVGKVKALRINISEKAGSCHLNQITFGSLFFTNVVLTTFYSEWTGKLQRMQDNLEYIGIAQSRSVVAWRDTGQFPGGPPIRCHVKVKDW